MATLPRGHVDPARARFGAVPAPAGLVPVRPAASPAAAAPAPQDLPFAVKVHFGPRDNRRTRVLERFATDPEQAAFDDTFLIEFWPYTLEFVPAPGVEPPADARLYMDGFDALVDAALKEDGDEVYLPCGGRVRIQGDDESEGRGAGRYPWIPGNYRVKVQWDGRSYYTVIRVRAKDLSERELHLMREELERYVVGLALDLVRRNQGMAGDPLAGRLPPRFYQYQLLEQHFPQIHAALQDIVRKPKHDVRKGHRVVRAEKAQRRDERSYRWRHSAAGFARNGSSGEPRFVLAPESEVYYDLPENRWVRRIVRDLVQTIDDIVVALEQLAPVDEQGRAQLEREKARHLATVRPLQSRLRAVLTEPFFQQVSDDGRPLPYTPAMQRDGRYRTLYRFWSDLKHHAALRVDAAFSYQWKRTDLLWEYWCFVRVIEALKQLGFEPKDGWIFARGWKFPDPVYIPGIPAGTRVVMERGPERIEIWYSQRLPCFRDDALREGAFLYALSRHNWPDIRLDYYQAGEYAYSVIVEAKYRRLNRMIMPDRERNPLLWSKAVQQLRAYRDAVYLVSDPRRRPVDQVIVLHPGSGETGLIYESAPEITFISLRPGRPDRHLAEHLAQRWPQAVLALDE